MPASEPIIRLSDISKVYRADTVETHALEKVNLSIYAGDFVTVSGPSGCGKSTLLSILGLLDCPSEGVYLLNGRSTARLTLSERARIRNRELGFVFHSFNLIGDLSVFENVELPLSYRGSTAAFSRQKVREALERVGLEHRARHYPSQLSGGEQQRVAVARAIVGEPVLLLADEPTGNLDTASGNSVVELLSELHQTGSTIVMVTHDPRYADASDRTVQLLDGQIADQPPVRDRRSFEHLPPTHRSQL